MQSQRAVEAKRLRAEGLTYQEIGDRMGISRQAAHILVNPANHRAYQRLRYKKLKEVPKVPEYKINWDQITLTEEMESKN